MTQNFFEGNDPFAFLRQMCANIGVPVPGMVFPTMDLADVERRIAEFKAVEQWLQMNLSTLQMTRQSLEMQRVAILSLTQMGTASQAAAAEAATTPAGNPFEAMAQLADDAAGRPADGRGHRHRHPSGTPGIFSPPLTTSRVNGHPACPGNGAECLSCS